MCYVWTSLRGAEVEFAIEICTLGKDWLLVRFAGQSLTDNTLNFAWKEVNLKTQNLTHINFTLGAHKQHFHRTHSFYVSNVTCRPIHSAGSDESPECFASAYCRTLHENTAVMLHSRLHMPRPQSYRSWRHLLETQSTLKYQQIPHHRPIFMTFQHLCEERKWPRSSDRQSSAQHPLVNIISRPICT